MLVHYLTEMELRKNGIRTLFWIEGRWWLHADVALFIGWGETLYQFCNNLTSEWKTILVLLLILYQIVVENEIYFLSPVHISKIWHYNCTLILWSTTETTKTPTTPGMSNLFWKAGCMNHIPSWNIQLY